MLIGAMNHPAHDVVGEIRWMAEMGLEFVDLTLSSRRAAATWQVDAKAIRAALHDAGMPAVGHTAYYLPLACAIEGHPPSRLDRTPPVHRVFAVIGVDSDEHPPGPARPDARAGVMSSAGTCNRSGTCSRLRKSAASG